MCTGDSGSNAVRMVSIDCKRSANNDGGVSLGKSKYNVATLVGTATTCGVGRLKSPMGFNTYAITNRSQQ